MKGRPLQCVPAFCFPTSDFQPLDSGYEPALVWFATFAAAAAATAGSPK
jgi:hypothetical protein